MPDILPPQLVGVQQRPVYVRVRTALTVLSAMWLVSAVTGIGFFSGGTTSLAVALVLMYGTGAALIVVICAVYRLVNRSAVKRTETRPEDAAAVAFVDTTRSATDELLAALRPAAERPRYAPASPRTVRPATAGSAADKPAAAAAATPAAAAAAAAAPPAAAPPAKQLQKAPAKTQPGQPQGTPAAKSAQTKSVVKKSAAKKGQPAKSAPNASSKSALNKSVPRTPAKNPPAKSGPAKSGQAKGRPANNSGTKSAPANNSGTKSAPAKRPGGSSERVPGKKQPSTKDSGSGPGPVASAQQSCSSPIKSSPIKATRPALVLASSNSMPQPPRQHVPDSRKRAS